MSGICFLQRYLFLVFLFFVFLEKTRQRFWILGDVTYTSLQRPRVSETTWADRGTCGCRMHATAASHLMARVVTSGRVIGYCERSLPGGRRRPSTTRRMARMCKMSQEKGPQISPASPEIAASAAEAECFHNPVFNASLRSHDFFFTCKASDDPNDWQPHSAPVSQYTQRCGTCNKDRPF